MTMQEYMAITNACPACQKYFKAEELVPPCDEHKSIQILSDENALADLRARFALVRANRSTKEKDGAR